MKKKMVSSSADENWNNRLYISKCKGLTCNKLLKSNRSIRVSNQLHKKILPDSKRSQAGIIVAILLILIVIGSVAVIWIVINNTTNNPVSKSGSGIAGTILEISQVKLLYNGSVQVQLKRGADNGQLTGLRFIFYNKNGNNKIISRDLTLAQQEVKSFFFSSSEIGFGLNEIDKVSVAPTFGDNLGVLVDEPTPRKDENGNRLTNLYYNLAIPAGSLSSWWKFDGDTEDSANRNDGILFNGASVSTNVLTLDGVDDYFHIGNTNNLFNESFTFSAWVKYHILHPVYGGCAICQDYMLYGIPITAMDGAGLYLSGSATSRLGIYGTDNTGGHPQQADTAGLNPNQWYFIAGTKNLTSLCAYVYSPAGQSISCVGLMYNFTADSSGTFEVGTNAIDGGENRYQYLDGSIDDAMVFNTSLSQSQLERLYENQNKITRP